MIGSSYPEHSIMGDVVIDGVKISRDEMYVIKDTVSHDGTAFLRVVGVDGFHRLLDRRLSEFPENLVIAFHNVGLQGDNFLVQLDISLRGQQGAFRVIFDAEAWKHSWSIKEFKEAFKEKVIELGDRPPFIEENAPPSNFLKDTDKFRFVCGVVDVEIRQIITDLLPFVTDLVKVTEAALEEKTQGDTLIAHFDFPDEVAVACEQYLVYFVQFLKDLGVTAEADLHHEAGELLFSIKPDAQDIALENIREALNIYLQLPANPNIGMMMPVGDRQTQQLSSCAYVIQDLPLG